MKGDRREFLKKGLYVLLGLFGLGFLVPGVALLSPDSRSGSKLVFFPLMSEDDLPRSGVKKSELAYTAWGRERKARVFVVASQTGLTVLSATCSHLGCLVNYNREKGEFICPCHGGRYDISGKNIAGPPPAPLTPLPFKIDQGMIMVGMKV